MVQILRSILNDGISLLTLGVAILAIVFVIATWTRTRSLVPTLGAVLMGAVVLFGVSNYDDLARIIETDVEGRAPDAP